MFPRTPAASGGPSPLHPLLCGIFFTSSLPQAPKLSFSCFTCPLPKEETQPKEQPRNQFPASSPIPSLSRPEPTVRRKHADSINQRLSHSGSSCNPFHASEGSSTHPAAKPDPGSFPHHLPVPRRPHHLSPSPLTLLPQSCRFQLPCRPLPSLQAAATASDWTFCF